MRIKYDDEADLQRKIVKILNSQGYHFEKTKSSEFCDLIDEVRKIYIEVKTEELFSFAQILYGLAKEKILDSEYIGLASAFELRLYKTPRFDLIEKFAREIDPELRERPSSVNKFEWNKRAFELFGEHLTIYTYDKVMNLGDKLIFVNQNNLEYFIEIFEKYEINPAKFINYIENVYAHNQKIRINSEGYIINENTGEFFDKKKTIFDDVFNYGYKPIRNFMNKSLLESTRIKSDDILGILHQFDRLEPIESRRKRGRYFTKDKISGEISGIAMNVKPDFIIEPYVGAGSLIDSLVSSYRGIGNDINGDVIKILKKKYAESGWMFTDFDIIKTSYEKLVEKWNVPKDAKLLILTNPPFGTSSTNILASKKGEIKKGSESRNKKIEYGTVGTKYGKGDLVIPAVGKLIDFIKNYGSGYLAFFCPAGVLCGRVRYQKLLKTLLKDFEFIEGHIFSGEKFNSICKKKPIAFTVWNYKPNVNTRLDLLVFKYGDKDIMLKILPLLKDGWNYGDGSTNMENNICVFRCERFNNPNPKMFCINSKKGSGSELSLKNVKKKLNIPDVPDELIYGLLSIGVGTRSLVGNPIYIDNAYVHLPDFTIIESMEMLVYILVNSLIEELKNNYCKGKIGFVGVSRVFKFGGQRLTDGAKYLIDKYGYCSMGSKTIKDVFEELQNEPDINKVPISEYKKLIRLEVNKRLEQIEYWKYIPIPYIENRYENDKQSFEKVVEW